MAVGVGEIAPGNAGKSGALRGIRGDRRAQSKVRWLRPGIYRRDPRNRKRTKLARV